MNCEPVTVCLRILCSSWKAYLDVVESFHYILMDDGVIVDGTRHTKSLEDFHIFIFGTLTDLGQLCRTFCVFRALTHCTEFERQQ